jgi:hypothetical protein
MKKLVKTLLLTLLMAAFGSLSAAPVGYSINSDSGTVNSDGLYRIDLATGEELERIGTVKSVSTPRLDVEGLAIAPGGTLYGVDDDQLTLFPISTTTALINESQERPISGLPAGGRNDFGMTFDCDSNLYITSVINGSLYQMDLEGNTTIQGSEGALGVKISALAAYGKPTRLYGLGNGLDSDGEKETPNLYQIDITSGTANLIGALGPAAKDYFEGGLAFDDAGQLWAITDRRQLLLPSQVMRINTTTGAASDVRNTTEEGFESLAITEPRGCAPLGSGEHASFTVQKQFNDGNNVTPVQLNIKCNTGLPLEQSLTVLPNEGEFGQFEVKFIVEDFVDGTLDCEVWEDTPAGYTADYDCQSNNSCSTNGGSGPCSFTGASIGQEDLCLIQNQVDSVAVNVTKQWVYTRDELIDDDNAVIDLVCSSVVDGDGVLQDDGSMRWSWLFEGSPATNTAMVYPLFTGETTCWTTEPVYESEVEGDSTCSAGITINPGDIEQTCSVTNTVFFEGIPSLNQYGMILFSTLMLLTGLIAVRRTV